MQLTYYDLGILEVLKDKNPLLVCDDAFDSFGITLPFEVIRFSDYTSNPIYMDIREGVKVLRKNKCDSIIAFGGGSSIDTAKGIKYYNHKDIPLIAVPTTSGTGSEATHFAAIYKGGKKYSIEDERLLPNYVILQSDFLKSLPIYQKKCTMLDALCQAIESWWSRKSSTLSVEYSQQAIKLIFENMSSYLKNEDEGNRKMLFASNLAGKAINITTTTAPHAMSYMLTSIYGLPHGHAVALCLPKVWKYMGGFSDIAKILGKESVEEAVVFLENLLKELEILPPKNAIASDIELLTNSVNTKRLKNNPVLLSKDAIREIYKEILEV